MLASGGVRYRALRWNTCTAVVATLVAGAIMFVARGAHADSPSELVQLTNSARAARGLGPLAVSGDLAGLARQQAARMAGSGTLSHTPNLSGVVCCWSAVGENVGEATSVAAVQQALMASPPHRANILSTSYTQIGVGVAVDAHGTLWVSEIFRQPNTAATPPRQPAPAAVPPAPNPPAAPPAAAHHPRAPNRTHAASPPAPAATPATPAMAGTGNRVSRDLARRPPLDGATRFASSLSVDSAVGPDPVSRLLGFVLATAG